MNTIFTLCIVFITAALSKQVQPVLKSKRVLPVACIAQVEPNLLVSLANNTVFDDERLIDSQSAGPTIRIAIVTYASRDIWGYAAYAMAINAAYAEYNGYSLTVLDETSRQFADEGDSRWNKVKILEEALDPFDGWAQDVDFLVWVDADFVFLDFNFRLESVATDTANLKAHMFISAGENKSTTVHTPHHLIYLTNNIFK